MPKQLHRRGNVAEHGTLPTPFRIFLTQCEGAKIAPATLRKHRTFTKQLTEFANQRGYVMRDQFTSADIRFCMNRGWLPKYPVSADMDFRNQIPGHASMGF